MNVILNKYGNIIELLRSNKKKIKQHKNEFLLSGVAQLVYMSQALFQNKIFAVNFDTDGFGKWSLLVSIYTLISMLPFTALDQGVFSQANTYKEKGETLSFNSMIICTYNIGFFVWAIIFFIYLLYNNGNVGLNLLYLLAYTFSEIIKNTFILIDNAYRNRKRVLYLRLSEFIIRLGGFLLLGYIECFTINNVLLIFAATNIFSLLVLNKYWINSFFLPDKTVYRDFLVKIFSFSLPLMSWAIFGWLQNMIGRWYLNALVDDTGVALYTMCVSISYFVPYAFYSVISTYLMPIIYAKKTGCTRKYLLNLLLVCFFLLCIYLVIIAFGGKLLILLLADYKYLDILLYLPFTSLSSILYVLAMLSTIEIYRQNNTKKLLLPTILPGIFMSTIGYYLILEYKLDGAIINYILGQILYCLCVFPLSYKSVKK